MPENPSYFFHGGNGRRLRYDPLSLLVGELGLMKMTSNVESQIPHRTKIGLVPLLGGVLALFAEATVMALLLLMAGICAFGSIIGGLIERVNPRRVTVR
jgi:hypothetical protein